MQCPIIPNTYREKSNTYILVNNDHRVSIVNQIVNSSCKSLTEIDTIWFRYFTPCRSFNERQQGLNSFWRLIRPKHACYSTGVDCSPSGCNFPK